MTLCPQATVVGHDAAACMMCRLEQTRPVPPGHMRCPHGVIALEYRIPYECSQCGAIARVAEEQRAAEARIRHAAEEAKRQLDPRRCDLFPAYLFLPARDVGPYDEAPTGDEISTWNAAAKRLEYVLCGNGPEPYLRAGVLTEQRWDELYAALGADDIELSDDRYRAVCPVCRYNDLICSRESRALYEVRLACLRGCDASKVGEQLARLIEVNERWWLDDDRTRKRQEMAAAVSIERLLHDARPMPWIVENVISDEALTLLVGESGDGKTFAAMMIAICVAAGLPLLGHATRQGRVLLVLLEGAAGDWTRRITQLARGLGVDPAVLSGKLDVYDEPLRVDDPGSYARLATYAAELGYTLLAIDNLTEIRSGAGQNAENSADTMANALRPLAALAHDKRLGVLLLHHAGASGALRGSTAIRQMCDEELQITKASPANNATITITRGKSRRGDGLETLKYKLIDVLDGAGSRVEIRPELVAAQNKAPEAAAQVAATADGGLTPRRVAILRIIEAAGADGVGINAVHRTLGEQMGTLPSKRDVSADLKWLVDDEQVTVDDAKKYRRSTDE